MVAINYLWNPINDNIVREFDDAGNTIAEYTAKPSLHGAVISEHRNGQTYYHHHDGQGNTVALTNNQGEVTDTFAYTANGEVIERTGTTPTPFQFGGKHGYYTDQETGELMVRRRVLSPELSRWLSVDPLVAQMIGHLGTLYDSIYSYVSNRPLAQIDPSGLQGCSIADWPKTVVRPCGIIGPNDFGSAFSTKITFSNTPPNQCRCCEFRQLATGQISRLEPTGMVPIKKRGRISEQGREVYEEDCEVDAGRRVCYGHRNKDWANSRYSTDGCTFTASDSPGYRFGGYLDFLRTKGMTKGRIAIHVNYVLRVVNTCNCPADTDVYNLPVVHSQRISINCELKIDLDAPSLRIIDPSQPQPIRELK